MKNIYLIVLFLVCLIFNVSAQQWEPTQGPYGGNVQSFYKYNNLLYAGTGAGLYGSNDNGQHWFFIDVGRPAAITSITAMNSRIFLGTDGDGILCSDDNGITWNYLNSGLSTYYRFCGYCIRKFSVSNQTIFAATGDGLYKLVSNDTTWTFVTDGFYNYQDTYSASGDTMLASESNYMGPGGHSRISTDGSSTFRYIYFPGDSLYSFASSFDITSQGIYAATASDLFYSNDLGYSWSSLYHDTGDYSPAFVKVIDDSIYVATKGQGIFISSVNNIAWRQSGALHRVIRTMFYSDGQIFAGTGYYQEQSTSHSEKGIYSKNISASTWAEQDIGLTAMHIYAMASSEKVVVAGGNNGVWISKDTGTTWQRHDLYWTGAFSDADNSFTIDYLATNGKYVLAASSLTSRCRVFISLDTGSTWTLSNQINNEWCMGLSIIGSRFIFFTHLGMYYSDNFGQSWTLGASPLSWIHGVSDNHHELFVADQNLYSSSDSGNTLSLVPSPPQFTGNLNNVLISDSTLFVNAYFQLYIGPKDGSNWFHASPSICYNSLGVVGSDVFAMMCCYSFIHSGDYGHTWDSLQLQQLPPLKFVYPLQSSKYFVFANIPSHGIWRYRPGIALGLNSQGNKTETSTFQLFPNPTHSTFTLHCPSSIINCQLKIYNSMGALVYQQVITSANQQIDLSGEGRGVYFLDVRNERRKIVLN